MSAATEVMRSARLRDVRPAGFRTVKTVRALTTDTVSNLPEANGTNRCAEALTTS